MARGTSGGAPFWDGRNGKQKCPGCGRAQGNSGECRDCHKKRGEREQRDRLKSLGVKFKGD